MEWLWIKLTKYFSFWFTFANLSLILNWVLLFADVGAGWHSLIILHTEVNWFRVQNKNKEKNILQYVLASVNERLKYACILYHLIHPISYHFSIIFISHMQTLSSILDTADSKYCENHKIISIHVQHLCHSTWVLDTKIVHLIFFFFFGCCILMYVKPIGLSASKSKSIKNILILDDHRWFLKHFDFFGLIF